MWCLCRNVAKRHCTGRSGNFWALYFTSWLLNAGAKYLEEHIVQDHVPMLIRIPPKYPVAEVIGYLKGKSAIAVARQFGARKRNFNGEQIRKYIRNQEQLDAQGSDEDGEF